MRGRKQLFIQRRSAGILAFGRVSRFLLCFYVCACTILVIGLLRYRSSHGHAVNIVHSQVNAKDSRSSLVENLEESKLSILSDTTSSNSNDELGLIQADHEGAVLKASDTSVILSHNKEIVSIRISNDEDSNILNVILTSPVGNKILKSTSASERARRRHQAKKKQRTDTNSISGPTVNSTELQMINKKKAKWAKVVAYRQQVFQVTQMLKNKTVPELRALVEQLQSKFDNDELISIRGFYSSGTNWLRALILHNCKNMTFERPIYPPFVNKTMLDVDGLYGWKHGLFLEREIKRLASRKNHKLVIISREAPTWALSAWKMFAMANTRAARIRPKPKNATQRISSMSFRGAYGDFDVYINRHRVNETGIFGQYLGVYYDIGYRESYRIAHDNVLGARTKVYRNWMGLLNNKEIANQVYFLRYEDLQASPYIEFQQLLHYLNIENCTVPDESGFDSVGSRVKYQVVDKKVNYEGRHPRKEFCTTVTSQATYQSILNMIDRDFELKVLGYAYPETLEEYCSLLHFEGVSSLDHK